MSKEAMKLAFEKVVGIPDAWTNPALMQARNGFIQGWEALAEQPAQQEPYAWEFAGTIFHNREEVFAWFERGDVSSTPPVALYTRPQAREPLTDEQISDLWCKVSNTDFVTADTHEFARAIEAKLREKNA
jgi:hypothetical protein